MLRSGVLESLYSDCCLVDGDFAGGARDCIGVGVMTVRCTGQPRTRSTSLFYTPLPCHPQTLARCSSVDNGKLVVQVDVLRLRARLRKAVSISNDIRLFSRSNHGCRRKRWSRLPTIEKINSTSFSIRFIAQHDSILA
jgi:hypothetical protein